MKPKFNNVGNPHIVMKHDIDCFISRSVTVISIVLISFESRAHLIVTKRSANMPDEPNKTCLPCGYLDYDETIYDAMVRETYEETSFYIPDYKEFLVFNNNMKPVRILDNPKKDARQNISFIYMNIYDFDLKPHLFPMDEIIRYSSDEVQSVRVIPLSQVYDNTYELDWAFKHDEVIKEAIKHYNKI